MMIMNCLPQNDVLFAVGTTAVATAAGAIVLTPLLTWAKAKARSALVGDEKQKSPVVDVLLSSVEKVATKTYSAPLDLVDKRQRHGAVMSLLGDASCAPSCRSVAMELYEAEGATGFYGFWWCIPVRFLATHALSFALKDTIKEKAPKVDKKYAPLKSLCVNIATGTIAGSISLGVVIPFDTVLNRVATAPIGSKLRSCSSAGEAMALVIMEQPSLGFFGLYTGFGVSILGMIQYRAAYFIMHNFLKETNPFSDDDWRRPAASFVISQIAALAAGLASFPFDVVRRGQQATGGSALAVATSIIATNGVLGLFTGATLNSARTVTAAWVRLLVNKTKAAIITAITEKKHKL